MGTVNNNTAVNIGVYMSSQKMFSKFSGRYPEGLLLNHMEALFIPFEDPPCCFL